MHIFWWRKSKKWKWNVLLQNLIIVLPSVKIFLNNNSFGLTCSHFWISFYSGYWLFWCSSYVGFAFVSKGVCPSSLSSVCVYSWKLGSLCSESSWTLVLIIALPVSSVHRDFSKSYSFPRFRLWYSWIQSLVCSSKYFAFLIYCNMTFMILTLYCSLVVNHATISWKTTVHTHHLCYHLTTQQPSLTYCVIRTSHSHAG